MTESTANRALLCALLLGDVALIALAPGTGLLSPLVILRYPILWILTAFSLVLFVALARSLPVMDRIVAGLIVPVAQFALPSFLDLTIHLAPQTLDGVAIALDGDSGWWLRSMVAALFSSSLALQRLCESVYGMLPLIITAAAALEFATARPAESRTLPAFVLTGCLGFALYMLMPVVGPAYYSGETWMVNPSAQLATSEAMPRNCMPSLHTAWTVLAYLATRGRDWPVRAVFAVALILTILATLGFGLHYLCDLAAAMPLVLVVRAVCHGSVRFAPRMAGLCIGTLLLGVWVLTVRTGGLPQGWTPVLLMTSTAIPLAWERWCRPASRSTKQGDVLRIASV